MASSYFDIEGRLLVVLRGKIHEQYRNEHRQYWRDVQARANNGGIIGMQDFKFAIYDLSFVVWGVHESSATFDEFLKKEFADYASSGKLSFQWYAEEPDIKFYPANTQ